MKKLIVLIFLIIPLLLLAQWHREHRSSVSDPYCPEARQFFNRLTDQPDPEVKAAINTMITSLVTNGVWRKLDGLYSLKTALNLTDAHQNLIQNRFNATEGGNANTGLVVYTGMLTVAGTSGCFKTGFIPATAAGNYSLNSAALFCWTEDSTSANTGFDMGNSTGTAQTGFSHYYNTSGGRFYGSVNLSSWGDAYIANTVKKGFFTVSRTASNLTTFYYQNVSLGTKNTASYQLPTNEFYCFAANQNGSPYVNALYLYSFFGWGAGLTATDVSNLYSALGTLRTAVDVYMANKVKVWYTGGVHGIYVVRSGIFSSTTDIRTEFYTIGANNNNVTFNSTDYMLKNTIDGTVGTSSVKSEGDDACPIQPYNTGYIAGNHGLSGLIYQITMAGHNKTSADLGQRFTDANGKSWYLLKISGNILYFISRPETLQGTWIIMDVMPSSGTLTWVAGGSNHGNLTIGSMTTLGGMPISKNLIMSITTDKGVGIAPGKIYVCNYLEANEQFDIADPHRQNRVVDPDYYTITSANPYSFGDPWITIKNRYRYNCYGQIAKQSVTVLNEMRFGSFGYLQFGRMAPAVSGYTNIWCYFPRSKWLRIQNAKTVVTPYAASNPQGLHITSHGWSTGQKIKVEGVHALVDGDYTITKVNNDSITLDGKDGTGSSYTSGGTGTLCWDPKNIQDITIDPSISISLSASYRQESTKPVNRFIEFASNADAVKKIGFVAGFLPDRSLGIDTARYNHNSADIYIDYSSGKNYPMGITTPNTGSTVVTSGNYEITSYRNYFNPQTYASTGATDVYFQKEDGVFFVWIDFHTSVTDQLITLPAEMTGKIISEVESETCSCNESGQQVPAAGIHLSTTGNYGYIVLKLQ